MVAVDFNRWTDAIDCRSMPIARKLVAALSFVTVALLLGGTLAHGLYYRSDHYRRGVERKLALFFGLPVDVSAIDPHGFTSRRLSDIRIWLPDRRAMIFSCPSAVWDAAGVEGSGGDAGGLLHVADAQLEIGSEEWESEDYMRVLRASLAQDFRSLDIRRIVFEDATIAWPRADFRLAARGVNGEVDFDRGGRGQATLTSHTLNGYRAAEPVQLLAAIDPLNEHFLPEVTLVVPRLPLAELGIASAVGGPVTRGAFTGRMVLRESAGGQTVELDGRLDDVQLAELTRRVEGGAIPALVKLDVEHLLLRDRVVERVVFAGELRDLDVDALLTRFGLPELGGRARIMVHAGRWDAGRLERLNASGQWVDGSLDALTRRLLGRDGATGRLSAKVNGLVVEDDVLVGGDVDLTARPAGGESGTLDRELLIELAERLFGVRLPEKMLPEKVPYVQMGARLLIERGKVRVLSGEGPAGRALVTVRVFGQDLPLLAGVDRTFSIEALPELLEEHAARLEDLVKRKLRRGDATPSTRPAVTPAD